MFGLIANFGGTTVSRTKLSQGAGTGMLSGARSTLGAPRTSGASPGTLGAPPRTSGASPGTLGASLSTLGAPRTSGASPGTFSASPSLSRGAGTGMLSGVQEHPRAPIVISPPSQPSSGYAQKGTLGGMVAGRRGTSGSSNTVAGDTTTVPLKPNTVPYADRNYEDFRVKGAHNPGPIDPNDPAQVKTLEDWNFSPDNPNGGPPRIDWQSRKAEEGNLARDWAEDPATVGSYTTLYEYYILFGDTPVFREYANKDPKAWGAFLKRSDSGY